MACFAFYFYLSKHDPGVLLLTFFFSSGLYKDESLNAFLEVLASTAFEGGRIWRDVFIYLSFFWLLSLVI